jgi:hypothetical protein
MSVPMPEFLEPEPPAPVEPEPVEDGALFDVERPDTSQAPPHP